MKNGTVAVPSRQNIEVSSKDKRTDMVGYFVFPDFLSVLI